MLRLARSDDIDRLVELVAEFYGESGYPGFMDTERQLLTLGLADPIHVI